MKKVDFIKGDCLTSTKAEGFTEVGHKYVEDPELSFSYRTLAAMVNLEPWAAAFHHALNLMHENNGHGEISIKVVDGEVRHVDVLNKNKY
jgi:hypothetical protein